MNPEARHRRRSTESFWERYRSVAVPLALSIGLGGLTTTAVCGQDTAKETRSKIRRMILAEHPFVDRSESAVPQEPLTKAVAETASDPNTIVMEKVTVEGSPFYRRLHADIKNASQLKAQSAPRLGTGMYQRDFGKIRASALTIFYVPVLVDISR